MRHLCPAGCEDYSFFPSIPHLWVSTWLSFVQITGTCVVKACRALLSITAHSVSGTGGITAAGLTGNSIVWECDEHFPSALYKSSPFPGAWTLLSSVCSDLCYSRDIPSPLPPRKQGAHSGAGNGEELNSLREAAMANSTVIRTWWVTWQHFKGL